MKILRTTETGIGTITIIAIIVIVCIFASACWVYHVHKESNPLNPAPTYEPEQPPTPSLLHR